MKNRTERILAALCAVCLLLCLAPTFQAEQPAGADDLGALHSLYEAGLELERTGFRILEDNRISIREVPEEASDKADLLVVEIIPDESLEAHAVDLILQMFIRGDKECTLRQEIWLVPGEKLELAFLASSEDLLASCFRVFLMDKEDNRLSPPDQCFGSILLKSAVSGGSFEALGPYVPQSPEEEKHDHIADSPVNPGTGGTGDYPGGGTPQDPWPDVPEEEPAPTVPTQGTECPDLPDVDPSDTPLPEDDPTLPPAPSQPPSQEGDNNVSDEEYDFEDEVIIPDPGYELG